MKGSGCFNCPVKGCTSEYRGSSCENLRYLAGADFDPMTNCDHIRNMSDDELFRFLEQVYCTGTLDGDRRDSFKWNLEWLSRPYED